MARPSDAAAILAIYAPIVEHTAISFELEPPDVTEMAARIEAVLRTYPWLVLEGEDGRVEGYAYGTSFRARPAYRWAAEVSAYVREDARGRGVGRQLYRELLPRLTEQGFVTALAGIALPNDASVRLHEAMGFTPAGVMRRVGFKLGAWHDVGFWQRPLQDPPADPTPPRAPAP